MIMVVLWSGFHRRLAFRAEAQSDERERADLSVFHQILIVLEALQRIDGGWAPGAVGLTGEIAPAGEGLLDFLQSFRGGLKRAARYYHRFFGFRGCRALYGAFC